MMRPSVIVVSMSMLAACGGLAYLHSTREQASEEMSGTAATPQHRTAAELSAQRSTDSDEAVSATAASRTAAESPSHDEEAKPGAVTAVTPESVARWIKDADSPDAETRAAAIAALADAPKAQAMPTLERVVESGERNVDRHIALRSMHALALRDGDSTGQIRNAMNHAIYHGDDDGVSETAQYLLDDIEAELAARAQPEN